MSDSDFFLPRKIKYVLNGLGIALLLIILRLWHLTAISHDAKLEEARRPQQRVVREPAKRGTIRDRYNLPLAINKIQYQATIVYSQLQQIPTRGGRRRDYIHRLAEALGHELSIASSRIEDLIHAKAALYHQVPFVIKEELSEREYYRIKTLERKWLGVAARRHPRRCYPQGSISADIIGYMGSIDRSQYESIMHEIKTLKELLEAWDNGEEVELPDHIASLEEAKMRLEELKERAYSINDHVGKSGVERRFEELLRGFQGERSYFSDARGNFLRELPGGRPPQPGMRLLLTLSLELQAFAEQLLISNEKVRVARVSTPGSLEKSAVATKQPWIKGGAIVALEPRSGEVLALASYPRFDPNDFVATDPKKRKSIRRWLESEEYLADLWDGREPLVREVCRREGRPIEEEKLWISWDAYLNLVLPEGGAIKALFCNLSTIGDAVALQRDAELLVNEGAGKDYSSLLSTESSPEENNLNRLSPYLIGLESSYDKILAIDLCRLVVDEGLFDDELLSYCRDFSLSEHRRHGCQAAALRDVVQQRCKQIFHDRDFAIWRQEQGAHFLAEVRVSEKAAKQYPRPYLDIFDKHEKKLFDTFWNEHGDDLLATLLLGTWGAQLPDSAVIGYFETLDSWRHELLASAIENSSEQWMESFLALKETLKPLPPWIATAYLKTLRPYKALTRPLLGRYRHLRRGSDGLQREKDLAAAFYPLYGFGYGRSYAYRQATTQGSIFKLITAYAALSQHYRKTGELNPLSIVDNVEQRNGQIFVGYTADGMAIPQHYKGGRLPKSLKRHIGALDISKALVTSSNPYFSLLAGDILDSPEDLAAAARLFSYGSPTGINLPGEIAGKVPDDLSSNRTGLYAMAIGQHTLVVTPLQTAVMLAALANGGQIVRPKIVSIIAGKEKIESLVTEVLKEAWLPPPIRTLLLDSMKMVATQTMENSIKALKHLYKPFPGAIKDYTALGDRLVGKTSTAESVEVLDLEETSRTRLYNHLWFGGIAFEEDPTTYLYYDDYGVPELVVVVYLRYGAYGKDGAPLAAQIAQKWRTIKTEHGY